jgi:hypothetical protein
MFVIIEIILKSRVFKLFLIAAIAVYVWFMLITPFTTQSCIDFECSWQTAISTWKVWQTFNASIIAFLSTLLIVHSTKIIEQKNGLRKRIAAKAFMPIALAEISIYIVDIINLLDDLQKGVKDFKIEFKPVFPEAAFKRIEKFIEQSSHQDRILVEHLIIAINSAQIYDSRVSSILTDSVVSNKKDRDFYQITQCTLLHALLSGMFDFARGIDENYQVTHLNGDRFRIKDCPLYMTEPEIEKYKTSEIVFKLFISS